MYLNVMLYYIIFYHIYIASFPCDKRSNALYIYSVAAMKAKMHPLPVQIHRDLTRGSDREKALRKERERENKYKHVRRTMYLALISNRQSSFWETIYM